MRRSVVTVKIAFVGKAPGPVLLNKVRDLEERLEADNLGTVSSDIEGSAVHLKLSTANLTHTRDRAWAHVNELGLSSRTTVKVMAPEDWQVCDTCKGTGFAPCGACGGTGRIGRFAAPCGACDGSGHLQLRCGECHGFEEDSQGPPGRRQECRRL